MTTLDAFKASAWTALFTFIFMFGGGLVLWLIDVQAWATQHGTTPFPDPTVLGYGLVAAVCAAGVGFVNFVIRYAQSKGVFGAAAKLTGPDYSPSSPAALHMQVGAGTFDTTGYGNEPPAA